MPNKVYIKNKLKDKDEELAKKLEEEGEKSLLWGTQPDRNVNKNPPEKKESK